MSQISMLPTMPLDPAWLEQSAAFTHADPRMARAAMKLLFAAWRGSPPASIPNSIAYLSDATGLPQELVAERAETLTDGYEKRDDGRLHHVEMSSICRRMVDAFGPQIEEYAVSLAMVAQDPEQFSLVGVEANKKTSKVKGKTRLPQGFGFDANPELRVWCAENGYPAVNQQNYIMSKFCDDAGAKAFMYKDWVGAFRNYARNEITAFARSIPAPVWPEGHPAALASPHRVVGAGGFGGLRPVGVGGFVSVGRQAQPSRAQSAIDHNVSLLHTNLQRPRT